MNRLEVGEVVIGTVRGIKPYGAFIDIGGVSGLLHISEISHDHIDTPHSVFNVNDEVKVMIIDLDAERGRISLSTKQLEPEPGDMIKNRDRVYDMAEEMAAKYREQMRAKLQGTTIPSIEIGVSDEEALPAIEDEDVPPATEDAEVPPAIEAEEVPPAIEAEEVPPATEDEEVPSATEDEEVPSATEDAEVPPAIEAKELSPAIEQE
jgi:small subunit ribosomal protein S1